MAAHPLTGFDFEAWQAGVERRRFARRMELAAALTAGKCLLQLGRLWPQCSPFKPEVTADPHYIADHLENREHGFGWSVTILTVEEVK